MYLNRSLAENDEQQTMISQWNCSIFSCQALSYHYNHKFFFLEKQDDVSKFLNSARCKHIVAKVKSSRTF